MTGKATREQIVEAADRLFYERGFDHTSFADIAGAVKISRGNFYYHFKTKDQILDAVIGNRLSKTEMMLDRWQAEGENPADRIRSFIDILIVNGKDIRRYGCPVGSLSTELAKLQHASKDEAAALFTLFRTWLRRQFEQLGHVEEADRHALHLLAFSQGVATLSTAFGDHEFVKLEVRQMHDWLTRTVGGTAPTHH